MAGLLGLPVSVQALDIPLPAGAVETARAVDPYGSARIPSGPWDGEAVPGPMAEGQVTRRAWRAASSGLTPLQILAPIRDALAAQGYVLVFECADIQCGGFDFRYGLTLLPEPEMHVDLGNFRVLSALRMSDAGAEHLSLLASRSAGAAYLHMVRVTPGAAPTPREITLGDPAQTTAQPPQGAPSAALGDRLLSQGHAILDDLSFGTGAVDLEAVEIASLVELAQFLAANPAARLLLVGHTDDRGDLDANIALSKRRAEAVAKVLIAGHGVDPARVRADGVGYLAPVASNATEEGRERNRRVEAVIIDRDGSGTE